MKKWITCCLFSIVLMFVCLLPVQAAAEVVWDGNASSGFSKGSGSEDDPYLILSSDDLAYLSQSVAGGTTYKGQYIRLETDLNLNGLEWTPIGKYGCSFDGIFLGNHHTIRNLTIRKYADRKGLFGHACGEIRDLTVENCSIQVTMVSSESSYAGALVGYNYANIINCHTSGSIQVTYSSGYSNDAGGLVASNCGSILYCSSSCDVTILGGGSYCGNSAGGLIGCQQGYGTVAASFATGDVAARTENYAYQAYAYAGGLIGDCYGNDCTIANCYATGNVTASAGSSATAGGLVGSARTPVVNCFATGNVTSTHSGYSLFRPSINGKAINCYVSSAQVADSATANVTSVNPANFRNADWIRTMLWTQDDSSWTANDSLPTWTPERLKTVEIGSAEELTALCGKVLVGDYRLTADIDLSGITWEPILLNAGTFDGGGHLIRGLTLSGYHYDGGLFGDNAGTVRRLGMENCILDISCTGANTIVHAGTVAGKNFGLVQDCYATGSITARNKSNENGGSYKENSYAGGICGANNMGIIERCYSDVSTYATSNLDSAYAAGITASNYYSEVRSCFALGNVSTADEGGGVSGTGGTVTNCYASNAQSVNVRYHAVSGTKVDPFRFRSQAWITEILGWDTEGTWLVDDSLPALRIGNDMPSRPAYRIDSLRLHDSAGNDLTEIPAGQFWAAVSVTSLREDKNALVFLATYGEDGQFHGLSYFSLSGFPSGTGAQVGLPVDNKDGQIKTIKVFVIRSFKDMTPLSEALTFS